MNDGLSEFEQRTLNSCIEYISENGAKGSYLDIRYFHNPRKMFIDCFCCASDHCSPLRLGVVTVEEEEADMIGDDPEFATYIAQRAYNLSR